MKDHFLSDIIYMNESNYSERFFRACSGGSSVVILYYDTHLHTAWFAEKICNELSIKYSKVPVGTKDPVFSGSVEIELSSLEEYLPKISFILPYDPHGDILRWVFQNFPGSSVVDITLDLIQPDHLGSDLIIKSMPKINILFNLLADDESKSCLRNILLARWTGLRSWISKSSYECYFHPSFAAPRLIADCGSYVGDVTNAFLEYFNPTPSVICFEPDHSNYKKLQDRRLSDPNFSLQVEIVEAGVWNEKSSTSMDGSGVAARVADQSEGGDISLLSLDEFFADRPVPDYIKMDIEGAEREALQGASGILSSNSPNLAISLYHRPDDLWELPLQIYSYNNNYKFYIGHHSNLLYETVLYCVKNK